MSKIPTKQRGYHLVKKIHKRSKDASGERYLTEWEGYPSEKCFTWETRETLQNCQLFYDFLETTKTEESSEEIGRRKTAISKKRKREADDLSAVDKDGKRISEKNILVKLFTPTVRGSLSKNERFEIAAQQSMKCNLCLTPFHHQHHDLTFEIDHIIPLEQGGMDEKGNMQALCPGCHIYKTSILDRGVIARLLQASKSSGIHPTRQEILEQCQIMYRNKDRVTPPHRDEEMIDFAISAREILEEMCKRKVNRMLHIKKIIDPDLEDSSKLSTITQYEPPKKRRRLSGISRKADLQMPSIDHIILFIEQMRSLKAESSVVRMPGFELTIILDQKDKEMSNLTSKKFQNDLNDFFRSCISDISSVLEKKIDDIIIRYQKRSR